MPARKVSCKAVVYEESVFVLTLEVRIESAGYTTRLLDHFGRPFLLRGSKCACFSVAAVYTARLWDHKGPTG